MEEVIRELLEKEFFLSADEYLEVRKGGDEIEVHATFPAMAEEYADVAEDYVSLLSHKLGLDYEVVYKGKHGFKLEL